MCYFLCFSPCSFKLKKKKKKDNINQWISTMLFMKQGPVSQSRIGSPQVFCLTKLVQILSGYIATVTNPKLALRVKNLSYKSITHWPIRCSEKISLCSFQQPDRRAEIVKRVLSFKIINMLSLPSSNTLIV